MYPQMENFEPANWKQGNLPFLENHTRSDLLDQFDKNGVLLFKNFLPEELIYDTGKEWDKFHESDRESLPKNDEPLVVFWRHIMGEKKKLQPLSKFPSISKLVYHKDILKLVKSLARNNEIRLLETIIFNKPAQKSNYLNWHQDVAYFPFDPNNQIAVWLPLDVVDQENGVMEYVIGSHKKGLMGSTNLHTQEPFDGEDRPIIPKKPEDQGFSIKAACSRPGDLVVHHGFTWHRSAPNYSKTRQRRGLSLRYLVGQTKFKPRAGSAATFIGQVEVQPGDTIEGKPFPLL